MAAGLGFKTFTTGEVLTAADTNGYLMQGVLVFATAAARDAAITSPQEGQFAFTKDTNGLWYYDGAAWVASGATGDIEGVTAGVGISGGGTSGTVTVTNSMATAIDAKGDLVVGTGADAFSRLAVGTNTYLLTADSAEATGLKWAAPAGGGGMTSIASGSLSGSALSLTGIVGTYKDLILVIRDYYASATNAPFIRVNADATANAYSSIGVTRASGSNTVIGEDATNWASIWSTQVAADNNNALVVQFFDYANTTARKMMNSTATYAISGYTANTAFLAGGWNNTDAITGVSFSLTTGTFSGGTYILYGVN